MKHSELISRLQKLTHRKPNLSEIARILGFGYSTIGNRSSRNSDYSYEEVEKISQFYDINLINNSEINTMNDKVEIPYYVNENLQTDIKTSAITSIWFDRELVENIWHTDPDKLRIISMPGDKMNNGAYPLRKGDVLIMDISDRDVTKAGIFAFTTHNNAYLYINGVNRRFDGSYRCYFYNQNYPDKILTEAEVIKADIRVVGRIIKNLSLTI